MCGRFTYKFTWKQIHEQLEMFGAALSRASRDMRGPKPSYNAAPKSQVPVLRRGDDGLDALEMRWWLLPHWSKTPDIKYATFNARSEDAASKSTFRTPFRKRRCVIPASGFYEWKKLDDETKQPYYITRADGQPIYFAGLWDRWGDPEIGPPIESCAILTTAPNAEMSGVHNRMPCILEPESVAGWLDPAKSTPEELGGYLATAADGLLAMHTVDRRVGNVRNNDAGLIEPV